MTGTGLSKRVLRNAYSVIMYITLTRHMQLSSSSDKLSGLGFVGSADIDASMVTPCVPNHQVCCEYDHISGNGLSI